MKNVFIHLSSIASALDIKVLYRKHLPCSSITAYIVDIFKGQIWILTMYILMEKQKY